MGQAGEGMLRILIRGLALAALGALLLGSCAPDLSLDLRASGAGGSSAGAAGSSDGGDRGTCLTCASCTSDADCANGATQKICNNVTDTLGGLCVACLRTADCKDGRVCDPVTLQCVVQCTVSGDTACGTQGRTCDASVGLCVECLADADCTVGNATICNHDCVECVKEGDCTANGLHCWLQRHSCVTCVVDADCPTGNVCSGKHLCIPTP